MDVMEWQYTVYIFPLLSSFVVLSALTAYSYLYLRRKGTDRTVLTFAVFTSGTAVMSLTYLLQLISTSISTKVLMAKVLAATSPLIVLGWFFFAAEYTGRSKWVTKRTVTALSVVPAVTVFLIATNPLHGGVWGGFELREAGSLTVLDADHALWLFVYACYGYVLGLAGVYYFVRMSLRGFSIYRKQSVAVLLGVLVALTPSVAFVFDFTPVDYTPMVFAVSGVAFWFAVFRYRFLEIVPVARDTVVENLHEPYFVLDNEERVVDLNTAAEGVIGAEDGTNLVGKRINETLPELNERPEGGSDSLSLGEHAYDVTHSRVERDGRKVGEVVLMRDITELKERESELKIANERLERFADVVSHDLRNPLTVAQGQLDLALREEGNQEERLESVESAHLRMQTIIEEVLSMARKGEPEPTEVELEEVARESWKNVDTYDAGLRVVDSVVVEADRESLSRVFENLFRNSVEHGGRSVEVEVGDMETEEGEGFYVQDDGPGFDSPEDAFDALSDTAGLGMWIVNDIVEAHGWSAFAENADGARIVFLTQPS